MNKINTLENLRKCVEESWLRNLPSYKRPAREKITLSISEKEALEQNTTLDLSGFLETKLFFYVSKIEYLVGRRIASIEFIDNPDISIEEAAKVVFVFSKISYFLDEWNGDSEELETFEDFISQNFVDSVISFGAYLNENSVEYSLLLSNCEITFRTLEMPQIK